MAAPTFRSAANDTGSGSGFTTSEPSGSASGDGIVLLLLIELSHPDYVPPDAGTWTPIPNCNNLDAGSDFTAYSYYTLRGGSAVTATVSWTGGSYYEWSAYAFQSVSGASFIDASAATASTSTANPDPPSITTTVDDTLICAIAFTWAGFAAPGATAPATYTLRFGTTDYDHALATTTQGTAGAVNPGTFSNTYGSGNTRSMTVALSGTGGGGGGGVVATPDYHSTLSFPALCRKPANDNGRWIRSKGGLWTQRKAA